MIVVIEVTNGRGGKIACKEYDAPSVYAAILAAEKELRDYPHLQISDYWIKEDLEHHFDMTDDW